MYSREQLSALDNFFVKLSARPQETRLQLCQKNLKLLRLISDFTTFYRIIRLLPAMGVMPFCRDLKPQMLHLIINNHASFLQTAELIPDVSLIPHRITDRQDFIIMTMGKEHIKKFPAPSIKEIAGFIELGVLPVVAICDDYIPTFAELITTQEQFHELFGGLTVAKLLELCRYQERRLVQLIPEYEIFKYYVEFVMKRDKAAAMTFITDRTANYYTGIFKVYFFAHFAENLNTLEGIVPGANNAILTIMPEFGDISEKGIIYFCQGLELAADPWILAKKFKSEFYVERLLNVDDFRIVLAIIQFRHRIDFCKLLPTQKIDSLLNSAEALGKILNVLTFGEVTDDVSALEIVSQFLKFIDKKKLVKLIPDDKALNEINDMILPELHESLAIIIESCKAEKTASIKVDVSVSSKEREFSTSTSSVRLMPAEDLRRAGSASFFNRGRTPTPEKINLGIKSNPGIPFIAEHYEFTATRSKSSI